MSSFEEIIVTGCGDCPWVRPVEARDNMKLAESCGLHYPMGRLFAPEDKTVPMAAPKWCRLRKVPVIYRLAEHVNQFVNAQGALFDPTIGGYPEVES